MMIYAIFCIYWNGNDHLFTPFSYFLTIYLLNLADEGGVWTMLNAHHNHSWYSFLLHELRQKLGFSVLAQCFQLICFRAVVQIKIVLATTITHQNKHTLNTQTHSCWSDSSCDTFSNKYHELFATNPLSVSSRVVTFTW